MIRFLLRFLGLLLLALAFIFVIYDGMKSIADRSFYATAFGQFWTEVHAGSLQAAQTSVERNISSTLWNLAISPILEQPAAAIFAIFGVVLIVLGRKKKPLIGYARD
jgi:ABC-type phosphate transport system permease subunit